MITFSTTPYKIGSWLILRLPKAASTKLPSRGQTMVKGTINGYPFATPLEPDGWDSHWFRVDAALQKAANVRSGTAARLAIESTKEWPEPKIPTDIQAMLASHPKEKALWNAITPLARWDWVRWVGSTKQAETRKRHVEVMRSKLSAGTRRPCCFNRKMCCVQEVSKNGALLGPRT